MERVSATGPPLLITDDQDLLEEVHRLCAAASVTPEVVSDPSRARRSWWQASCVLVGADQAGPVARLGLTRRDGVVLVSAGPDTASLWRQGVSVRADHVAVLPGGQQWLVDRLVDAADGASRPAATLSVVGACGGAGASTLAAALGMTAARAGISTLLVDADPLAGGLDLVVGCEDTSGLRWPEVAATQGRVGAAAFRSALPATEGLAVLSWDRGEPADTDASTMQAMLEAGQRGSDLVVIDVPRRVDDVSAQALVASDVLLLVSSCDVRAVAAARRLLPTLRRLCVDIRLVARKAGAGDVTADALAAALDLPLAAELPTQRGLARSLNDGLGPLARARFARSCLRLLREVDVVGGPR